MYIVPRIGYGGSVSDAKRQEYTQVTQTTQETESDVRRALITQFIRETPEPMTAKEISYGIGIEVSSVRKELTYLLSTREVFARQETAEERSLRFDGQPRATPANLYSTVSPVPERKSREVVKGFVAESTARTSQMSTREVNARLASAFAKRSEHWQFTTETLAALSGVTRGTLHPRLRSLEDVGFITVAGSKNGCRLYVVKDKRQVLSALGISYTVKTDKAAPAPALAPEVKTPPVPEPPKQWTVDQLETRAIEILAENERLRAQVTALKAQVDALSAPAVNPHVAEALAKWQPSV